MSDSSTCSVIGVNEASFISILDDVMLISVPLSVVKSHPPGAEWQKASILDMTSLTASSGLLSPSKRTSK